jgi:hypothetical protein
MTKGPMLAVAARGAQLTITLPARGGDVLGGATADGQLRAAGHARPRQTRSTNFRIVP